MTNKILTILVLLLLAWNIFLTSELSIIKNSQYSDSDLVTVEVDGISTDFTKIVEENRNAVCAISADGNISSGFAYSQIGSDVYVVTSYHGVAGAMRVDVIFNNNYRVTSEIIGYDPYSDLAVLVLNSPYEMPTIAKGNSEALKAGEFLIAIGTKGTADTANSVELGMVSYRLRTILNSIMIEDYYQEYYSSLIQLTASLQKGYSGAPLFNMNGDVVGIVTMAKDNENIYAFPIDEASYIIENIINDTDNKKVNLGIKGSFLSQMPTYQRSSLSIRIDEIEGLYVEKMTASSRAALYGIKERDIILSINDVILHSNTDLLKVLYSGAETFDFKILRDNETISLSGIAHD